MTQPKQKIISLETWRGIAAIIVVISHYMHGFLPTYHGEVAESYTSYSWIGEPWFVLMNGVSSVVLFFVLSGFVLSLPAFDKDKRDRMAYNVSKRLSRLAMPAFLSVLLSYFLFKTGLYFFEDTASITESKWLNTFACSFYTKLLPQDYDPSFFEVAIQGLWLTFFTGESHFNTNLWTMKYEFFGSLFVFGTAMYVAKAKNLRAAIFSLIFMAIAICYISSYFVPFIAGVLLCYLWKNNMKVSNSIAWILLIAGIYIQGYFFAENYYGWLFPFENYFGKENFDFKFIIWTFSAFFILYATLNLRALDRLLSGKIGKFLGEISFPLYLIHTLIFCSFGSWAFKTLHADGYSIYIVHLGTIITSLVVIIPLTLLFRFVDLKWVHMNNQIWMKILGMNK